MMRAKKAGAMPATTTSALPPARRPRGPWAPTTTGPYKLPRVVEERLTVALASFRNREQAYALAIFVGRFWTAPARLVLGFPVDRRALADHPLLGLSEHQVRAARDTLEAVGFLARQEPEDGRHYQRTADGPHRRPIIYRFGLDYLPAFATANRRTSTRWPVTTAGRSSVPARSSSPTVSHKQTLGGAVVLMGEKHRLPEADAPESALDAALARWRRAIEG